MSDEEFAADRTCCRPVRLLHSPALGSALGVSLPRRLEKNLGFSEKKFLGFLGFNVGLRRPDTKL